MNHTALLRITSTKGELLQYRGGRERATCNPCQWTLCSRRTRRHSPSTDHIRKRDCTVQRTQSWRMFWERNSSLLSFSNSAIRNGYRRIQYAKLESSRCSLYSITNRQASSPSSSLTIHSAHDVLSTIKTKTSNPFCSVPLKDRNCPDFVVIWTNRKTLGEWKCIVCEIV